MAARGEIMKRFFMLLIVALLCVWIPASVSGLETITLDDTSMSLPVRIKAVYQQNEESNVYESGNINGTFMSITTNNRITVAVTGSQEFDSGTQLVVREITKEETEAYGWFSEVMQETGSSFMPFEIFFLKNGQRVPMVPNTKVSITLPDSYTDPFVCSVTANGEVEVLQSTIADGNINFEIVQTNYYVLADKRKDPAPSPTTGDNKNLSIYMTLMALVEGIFVYSILEKKRKKLMRYNSPFDR